MEPNELQIKEPYNYHHNKTFNVDEIESLKKIISYEEDPSLDDGHELFLKRLAYYASVTPSEDLFIPYALDVKFINTDIIESFIGITNAVYPKSWKKYLEGKR